MKRASFKLLGALSAAVGIVGAFLPLLPSTIFFILAAALFARSSPELEARIINHPVIGPPVIAWREHGAIPHKAKLLAFAGMFAGYILFVWSVSPGLWLAVFVALTMIACALYVGTRPSGPQPQSTRKSRTGSDPDIEPAEPLPNDS